MARRTWLVLLLTAITAVAALFVLYLVQSQVGLRSGIHSVDWASHLAMVDLLARGADVSAHRAEIGTGAVSPLFAHGMAATLSRFTGLSTVRTVELVVALALIVSVVVAGARAVAVTFVVGQDPAARFGACLAAAAVFLFFSNIGLGFYGQVTGANFFFSQAVSTALALVFLSAIQAAIGKGGRVSLYAIATIPILTPLLGKFQLVPALWFAASGTICVFSLERPIPQRLALAAGAGVLAALLLLSEAETVNVMQLPQAAKGMFNIRLADRLLQLNTHPSLLLGGLVAMAALICIVALIEDPARLPFRLINLHAGALAVLLLGVMILATLLVRGGGYYGLAKFGYLLAAETALLAGHIAATALNRLGVYPARPLWIVPALLLMICAQQRGVPALRHDQSFLIALQQELSRTAFPSKAAPFPLDERLSAAEQLYLFTGPMGQAKNGRAYRLLRPGLANSPAAAREVLLPSRIANVVPAWNGDRIAIEEGLSPLPLIFFGGWGTAGTEGRPAMPPAAHVAFRVAPRALAGYLCVRLLSESSVEATFALNGDEARRQTLRKGANVVELPLQAAGADGDVVLSILHERRPDVPKPGVLGLQALWLNSVCGQQ